MPERRQQHQMFDMIAERESAEEEERKTHAYHASSNSAPKEE